MYIDQVFAYKHLDFKEFVLRKHCLAKNQVLWEKKQKNGNALNLQQKLLLHVVQFKISTSVLHRLT